MASFLIGLSAGIIVVVGALTIQWWRNIEYTRDLSRLYIVLMSLGLVVSNGIVEDEFGVLPPLGFPEWTNDVTIMLTLAFLVLTVYVQWRIRRDNSNPVSEVLQ